MKPVLHLFAVLLLFSFSAQAQKQISKLDSCFWVGKVNLPTLKITTGFYISEDENGNKIIKLDIPEQAAKGLPGEILKISDDSVVFTTTEINRTFYGEFINDSTIKGDWIKNRIGIPLILKKAKETPILKRPQTPKPPFPYIEEEVEYFNTESGFKLAGTLTIPEQDKKCPAVAMITGSGAQDRDESIFEHKMFWVVADYFARNGIAVLRVDDRGIGGSEGKITESTSEDFAGDALAGVAFLKNRKEFNPNQIGLIGHSEGGLIAPIAANRSEDVAFFIMMAGPGMIGEEILYEQNDLSLKAAGMPDYAINQNRMVQKRLFEILKNESDSIQRIEKLRNFLSQGFYPGMDDQMKKAVDDKIVGINNNWFHYFLTYDPQPTLANVKCPVLAINGVKDVQVPVSNLDAIKKALTEGGNTNVKTIAFDNLNHLFQNCNTGAAAEYSQIEETIDPKVLETMKDWILKINSNLQQEPNQ